jgi:hypothetical protein
VPVLISRSINIWSDIVSDGAGLACEDTVDSFESLMIQWFELSPVRIAAMKRHAQCTFKTRYTSRHAAVSLLSNIYQVMAAEKAKV